MRQPTFEGDIAESATSDTYTPVRPADVGPNNLTATATYTDAARRRTRWQRDCQATIAVAADTRNKRRCSATRTKTPPAQNDDNHERGG